MTGRKYRVRLMALFVAFVWLSGCSWLGVGGPDGEDVIDVGTPGNALPCAEFAASADTQIVGPGEAAQLNSGNSRLIIPANAMPENRQLIFRQLPGDSAMVEVDQEIRFDNNKSATLIVDVSRCDSTMLGNSEWFVWRVHPATRSQSQKLRTRFEQDSIMRRGARAVTVIDSTSGFLIAN